MGQKMELIIGSSSAELAFAHDVKNHCPEILIFSLFANRCIYYQAAGHMAPQQIDASTELMRNFEANKTWLIINQICHIVLATYFETHKFNKPETPR